MSDENDYLSEKSDERDNDSYTLSERLVQAIDNDDLEHVRRCIEQGVDVNYRDYYSELLAEMYPLALACCRGHEQIMEELLKAGVHPNQVSGWPPRPAVFMAAKQRVLTLSMLRCLISHGAGVDFKDQSGGTILHYLARGQFSDTRDDLLSAVKLVLDNGASFYARDYSAYTPLYEACREGNIDLVKFFIAEGADVNFGIGHVSMLTGAANRCDIDIFDLLLNAGANRHLNPDALAKPCDQNEHAMIARILDTCDVDINLEMRECDPLPTLLLRVCWYRHVTSETVRLLIDRGADIRAVTSAGNTALHCAVRKCDCTKIRQLLSYNHPLNIKNNKNQTPLSQLIEPFINSYSLQQVDAQDQCYYVTDVSQVTELSLIACKMLVIAGAKVTVDDEHKLNKFYIKHPEAQLPCSEIRSTRSLKEMCRFVIRGAISVPVDVSMCKLPIPKLLQEYLNFPEFDPLVENYLNIFSTTTDYIYAYAYTAAAHAADVYSDDYPNDYAATNDDYADNDYADDFVFDLDEYDDVYQYD